MHKMRAIPQQRSNGLLKEKLKLNTMEQTCDLRGIRSRSLMDLSELSVMGKIGSNHAVSIPQKIEVPQCLGRPEDLLRHIGQYFKWSFESGTWASLSQDDEHWMNTRHGQNISPLADFMNCCDVAPKLLKGPNRKTEAWIILNRAAAVIQDVLEAEHPNTLQEIISILAWFRRHRWPQVASIFTRQFGAMAAITFTVYHLCIRFSSFSGHSKMSFSMTLSTLSPKPCSTF